MRSRRPAAVLVPVLVLGTGVLCPAPAVSAALPLEEAAARALATHPAVGIARAHEDEATALAGEAAAARWPSLRFSAAATQYEDPMGVAPIHGFTPEAIPPFDRTHLNAGLGLNYTVFDGGARGGRIDRARSVAGAAGAALTASEQRLVARVARTYLEALGRREVLAAHDRRLAALAAERERATRLRTAGRAAQVEVLRVEAAIASAEAERVRLAATLEVAEQDLARLIGGGVEEARASRLVPVALADTTIPSREDLLATAQARSPAGEEARARAAAAAAGREVARGARWPAVDLFGNWIDRNSDDEDLPPEWSAGVQMSLPLFTGGAITQRIASADAAERGAGEELRLTELEIAADVDRAHTIYLEAHALVRSLETAVLRYAEVTRIEKLALDAGSGTQTDYLDAEADLLSAQARLTEAQNAEIVARIELARVSGELDRAWLARTVVARTP
jgi:outer membrane protein